MNDIKMNTDDLGRLSEEALRYCMGRETYMPDLIRSIVRPYLNMFPAKILRQMREDCLYQKQHEIYGDESIDKPGWIIWEKEVKEALKKAETYKKQFPETVSFHTGNYRDIGTLLICATRSLTGSYDKDYVSDMLDICIRYISYAKDTDINVFIQDLGYFDRFELGEAWWRNNVNGHRAVADTFRDKWYRAVENEQAKRCRDTI